MSQVIISTDEYSLGAEKSDEVLIPLNVFTHAVGDLQDRYWSDFRFIDVTGDFGLCICTAIGFQLFLIAHHTPLELNYISYSKKELFHLFSIKIINRLGTESRI